MPFPKRSKKLPAQIRRLTVYSFVFFCLLIACKKHMSVPSQASLQIRIDSLKVLGFNHIKVSATYSSADLSRDLRLGVCWGTATNPVASGNSIIQPQLDYNYLDTLISSLDSNTLYHLRAFCVEGRDTIYGTDTTIKTGALELTYLQQYGDTYNLELRQVVSLGTGGYIVLSQADPPLNPAPGANLTRFDTSGNRLWSMDYDVGQSKYPSLLLPVSDGYLFATDSLGYGVDMPVLCKIDLDGNLLWEKDFPAGSWSLQRPAQLFQVPNSSNIALSVAVDSLVGDTGVATGPFYQFVIDPNGNLQSTNQFGGINLWPMIFSTSVMTDGYLALLGTTSGGNYNGMILQYLDDNNSPVWTETYYRGRTILDPVAYVQDSKGNFTVLTWLDGQNNDSTWLFNLNASGSFLWQTTYPYSPLCGLQSSNTPKALALSSATNDYYATGENFILKTDPGGNYIWDIRIVPLELGIPGAIFVSPGNTITIIGTTVTGPIAGLFFSRLQEY